jgi:hypothetical protein
MGDRGEDDAVGRVQRDVGRPGDGDEVSSVRFAAPLPALPSGPGRLTALPVWAA